MAETEDEGERSPRTEPEPAHEPAAPPDGARRPESRCRPRLQRRVLSDRAGAHRRAAAEAGRRRASPGRGPRVLPGGQGADGCARGRPQAKDGGLDHVREDRHRVTAKASASGQAVGIDVGGTKTAAACVDRRRDRAGARDAADAGRRHGGDARDDREGGASRHDARGRAGVGIAAAGPGRIGGPASWSFAPTSRGGRCRSPPISTAELGVPAVADNDNTAAAWGEYLFGAGRGLRRTCCWWASAPGSAAGSSPAAGCSAARTGSRRRSATS